jgi:hypothetical protein
MFITLMVAMPSNCAAALEVVALNKRETKCSNADVVVKNGLLVHACGH